VAIDNGCFVSRYRPYDGISVYWQTVSVTLARRIFSATSVLTASGMLARMLSLITMPVLTRLLAPNAYGIAAIAGTMISLICMIAVAGMDMSYARAYHANRRPAGSAVEIFAWRYSLVSGAIAGVAATLVWWLIVADLLSLPSYLAPWIGCGVLLSVVSIMAQTYARLHNRYGKLAVSTIVAGLAMALVSVGVALWWRQDELALILSIVIGYLVPIAILGGPAVHRLCKASDLTITERIDVTRIGLAGIVTAPMFWILTSMDKWFLGYFDDSASVGIYSVGYSIGILGMIVNNAIQSVWLPEVAREYERSGDDARVHLSRIAEWLVSALALVWLAIAAIGGDIVRLMAGPAFQGAAEVIPYIAAGVLFYGISQLANGTLLLKHKLHYAMWWWLAAALLCVALNFVLVPIVGRLGAAITQSIAFLFVAGGIEFGAQKVFPLQIRVRRLGFVLAGIGVLGVLMSRPWSVSPVQSLLGKMPFGLLTMYVVGRLIAPHVLQRFSQRVWHSLSLKR